MSRPVKGFVFGVVAALIAVATAFAGSDVSLRWWPASLVSGAAGGGVIGTLFGAELAGEAPDEGYDGIDPKSVDGAATHGRTRTGRARKR